MTALDIGKSAEVRGGNYGAVALGTVTLLQALSLDGDKVSLPRFSVTDAPATEFRGLLVDLARRYHSIENLKQMVRLCRLYKSLRRSLFPKRACVCVSIRSGATGGPNSPTR